MNIREATSKRIEELCKARSLSGYGLCKKIKMPASTYKSIITGRSKNPGMISINKIAEGLDISIREFFDSELFDDLDADD